MSERDAPGDPPGYPPALMSTRTIVTSQPDIECDVCERRLLRGEQPEIFLAAGQPRTVCELCAPRAFHQGWKREADGESAGLVPPRGRRGRSLLERLRQAGRPEGDGPGARAAAEREPEAKAERYDFLADAGEAPSPRHVDARGSAHALPGRRASNSRSGAERGRAPRAESAQAGVGTEQAGPGIAGPLGRAVELFNASEYPRRVSGVARSLGAPEVNVQQAEGVPGVVRIVVAWELCWYRYRVDVDDELAGVALIDQGTELGELERDERAANANVDELGAVALIADA